VTTPSGESPETQSELDKGAQVSKARSAGTLRWLIIAIAVVLSATMAAISRDDPHYLNALAEADRLLSMVRLPPGARAVSSLKIVELQGPGLGTPASDHFIDRARWWIVPRPMDETAVWIQEHPPLGLIYRGGASGGPPRFQAWGYADRGTEAFRSAQLQMSVVADGPYRTALRVDGTAIWLTSGPARDVRIGPRIRVTLTGGCPKSIEGYVDVSNPQEDLTKRMLPSDDPTTAIICRYPDTSPAQRTDLSRSQARSLARVINSIRLSSPGSVVVNCPLDRQTTTVMVFGYRGRPDVDLWYHPSGCESLANGYVWTWEVGNPHFYEDFVPLVRSLTN
jgi:hypothetical protein